MTLIFYFNFFNGRIRLLILVVILWTHTTWQVQFASSSGGGSISKFCHAEAICEQVQVSNVRITWKLLVTFSKTSPPKHRPVYYFSIFNLMKFRLLYYSSFLTKEAESQGYKGTSQSPTLAKFGLGWSWGVLTVGPLLPKIVTGQTWRPINHTFKVLTLIYHQRTKNLVTDLVFWIGITQAEMLWIKFCYRRSMLSFHSEPSITDPLKFSHSYGGNTKHANPEVKDLILYLLSK